MPSLRFIRRGLLSIAALGLVVIIGLVAQRAAHFGPAPEPIQWHIDADVSLTGFRLDQVGEAGMELRLDAGKANLRNDTQRLNVDGLDLTVYQEGAASLTLRADHGNLALEDGTITVHGHDDTPTTLTVTDGPTVTAPTMIWHPKAQQVTTKGGATIVDGRLTATGDQAVATLNEERVQMDGNVAVVWR